MINYLLLIAFVLIVLVGLARGQTIFNPGAGSGVELTPGIENPKPSGPVTPSGDIFVPAGII